MCAELGSEAKFALKLHAFKTTLYFKVKLLNEEETMQNCEWAIKLGNCLSAG